MEKLIFRSIPDPKLIKTIIRLFLSLLIFLSIVNGGYSQENEQKDIIYKIEDIEVKPEFPGGKDSLNVFLRKSIHYPRKAMMNGDKGRVFIVCVIDKDGQITNVRLSHSESLKRESEPGKLESSGVKINIPVLEEEALRVVKTFPPFIPGKNSKGEKVNVEIIFPITFFVKGM